MPTAKDIVVKKPTEEEIATCKSWPIWTCEPSKFDWDYTQSETCLVLEGEITVTDRPEGALSVSFGPGDIVVFPVGLKCIWNVKRAVKKHYNFS
jgi:uncharacterized cupin superfamily protein